MFRFGDWSDTPSHHSLTTSRLIPKATNTSHQVVSPHQEPCKQPPKLKGSNTKLMAVLYCLLIPQTKHPHFQNSNNDQLISSVFHYQISHHHFFGGGPSTVKQKSTIDIPKFPKPITAKVTLQTHRIHGTGPYLPTFTTKSQRSI